MSKIELRPKRPPCPEGSWKMVCFKESVETYKGTKGDFQRQVVSTRRGSWYAGLGK